MKKIVIILCTLIVVLIAVVIVLVAVNHKPEEITPDVEVPTIVSENVRIKDTISQIKNSKRDINVVLPQFQNLENDFERYINEKIYNDLNENSVYNSMTAGMEEDEIGLFTYEVDYERYNCGDYISLVVDQYINLGGDRPIVKKKCYVINAEENASMSLINLFADKINYKSKILEEINKNAKAQNIELIGGNGLSTISDTQSFYIKDEKLYIYFEASEIAATAVGELEFEMPFEMVDGKFVF